MRVRVRGGRSVAKKEEKEEEYLFLSKRQRYVIKFASTYIPKPCSLPVINPALGTSAPWSWQEIHHRVAGEERQDQLGSVREHLVYAPFAPQGMQDERAGPYNENLKNVCRNYLVCKLRLSEKFIKQFLSSSFWGDALEVHAIL